MKTEERNGYTAYIKYPNRSEKAVKWSEIDYYEDNEYRCNKIVFSYTNRGHIASIKCETVGELVELKFSLYEKSVRLCVDKEKHSIIAPDKDYGLDIREISETIYNILNDAKQPKCIDEYHSEVELEFTKDELAMFEMANNDSIVRRIDGDDENDGLEWEDLHPNRPMEL